jgi:inner membrane transporter RhtA
MEGMTTACDSRLPVLAAGATSRPAFAGRPRGSAAALALASMVCVQLGAAASMPLFAAVGPTGAAWLRLDWAAVIFVVVVRPRPWAMPRHDLATAVLLGVVSAGMTLLFFEAIARIPLATAVAVEFLGPLAVAVFRQPGRAGLVWPALAAVGVVLVTQPWHASADPVGIGYAAAAAICWAGYILLTQRVGDRLAGLDGLAISMPAAALVATVVAAPNSWSHLSHGAIIAGAGLALLLPVLPYVFELLALRRLSTAAFGTLMSLEPAVALVVGTAVLAQTPQPAQALGVLLVTAAAVGAARTGRRSSPVAALSDSKMLAAELPAARQLTPSPRNGET